MPKAKLTFRIAGPPRSKKNSQAIITNPKTKRPMIIPSAPYRAYERECIEQLKPVRERLLRPIDYPINLRCDFYVDTRRKVDLVNLLEAACDVLVKGGILADDNRNICYSHDGSRVYWDKEHPRTVITITPAEDYEEWGNERR